MFFTSAQDVSIVEIQPTMKHCDLVLITTPQHQTQVNIKQEDEIFYSMIILRISDK